MKIFLSLLKIFIHTASHNEYSSGDFWVRPGFDIPDHLKAFPRSEVKSFASWWQSHAFQRYASLAPVSPREASVPGLILGFFSVLLEFIHFTVRILSLENRFSTGVLLHYFTPTGRLEHLFGYTIKPDLHSRG